MDLTIRHEVYRELGAAPALPEGHLVRAENRGPPGRCERSQRPLGRDVKADAQGSGREEENVFA